MLWLDPAGTSVLKHVLLVGCPLAHLQTAWDSLISALAQNYRHVRSFSCDDDRQRTRKSRHACRTWVAEDPTGAKGWGGLVPLLLGLLGLLSLLLGGACKHHSNLSKKDLRPTGPQSASFSDWCDQARGLRPFVQ